MASSVSSHHNVDVIGGMSVRFPFAPYEGQICIMNSVLDCILQVIEIKYNQLIKA